MDAQRRILCYTNTRNAALGGFVCLPVYRLAVSKQAEAGDPCQTFPLCICNYVLYSFQRKLYNKSGTPPFGPARRPTAVRTGVQS